MSDASARKKALRREALARRAAAHAEVDQHPAVELLDDELKPHAGRTVSFYMPVRSEIDPRPAMVRAVMRGRVLLPVCPGLGHPLIFREWQPGARLAADDFGIEVPVEGARGTPEVLVVPLLAFDGAGYRLGYGGGYYDRTLEQLRKTRPTVAIGFAYSAQEVAALPVEPYDQPLDLVVTEADVRRFT